MPMKKVRISFILFILPNFCTRSSLSLDYDGMLTGFTYLSADKHLLDKGV
jgi:hypothetical protein